MNRILVVNNDIDTMDLLKQWLESRNYMVKYTGSREEVAGLMKNFIPHLVIADILQYHVIDDIRNNYSGRATPILMMSGYTKDSQVGHLDVDDIIEKPFNFALLEMKVAELIANKRSLWGKKV